MGFMLQQLLNNTTCGQILKKSQPITLDADTPVHDACATLASHKISSAPVFDAQQNKFVGVVDYRDIVAHVLTVLHKIPAPPKSLDADWVFKFDLGCFRYCQGSPAKGPW